MELDCGGHKGDWTRIVQLDTIAKEILVPLHGLE